MHCKNRKYIWLTLNLAILSYKFTKINYKLTSCKQRGRWACPKTRRPWLRQRRWRSLGLCWRMQKCYYCRSRSVSQCTFLCSCRSEKHLSTFHKKTSRARGMLALIVSQAYMHEGLLLLLSWGYTHSPSWRQKFKCSLPQGLRTSWTLGVIVLSVEKEKYLAHNLFKNRFFARKIANKMNRITNIKPLFWLTSKSLSQNGKPTLYHSFVIIIYIITWFCK